jgi:hypothetical protein
MADQRKPKKKKKEVVYHISRSGYEYLNSNLNPPLISKYCRSNRQPKREEEIFLSGIG